jgi:hypothetical protein
MYSFFTRLLEETSINTRLAARRVVQVLIEITPSQRSIVSAIISSVSACSRFRANGIDRGHIRIRTWDFPEEKKGISAAA